MSKSANNAAPVDTPEVKEIDLTAIPGFHVLQGKLHLGTYATREDALAFIDTHLTPNGVENATVLEVE